MEVTVKIWEIWRLSTQQMYFERDETNEMIRKQIFERTKIPLERILLVVQRPSEKDERNRGYYFLTNDNESFSFKRGDILLVSPKIPKKTEKRQVIINKLTHREDRRIQVEFPSNIVGDMKKAISNIDSTYPVDMMILIVQRSVDETSHVSIPLNDDQARFSFQADDTFVVVPRLRLDPNCSLSNDSV